MMSRINTDLDETSSDYQRRLADLRGLVRAAIAAGDTYERIAAAAFVCKATVVRLADGTTRKPSDFTIQYVAKALGYRSAWVPIDTPKLPNEIGR